MAASAPERFLDLIYDWEFWGRENQQWPEGDWLTWLLLAGRGFGKTRTGSEACHRVAKRYPGCIIGIVGRTAGDTRDILVEGPAGLLATADPRFGLHYEPSKLQLTYRGIEGPDGRPSIIKTFGADEPRKLRGANTHFVWADELAAYEDPDDVWSQIRLGLRLPRKPWWPDDFKARAVVTTTPLAIPIIRKLVKDPRVYVTRGSSYDNQQNLNEGFFEEIIQFDGTRLGRQEVYGEILEDVPGALWKPHFIDKHRLKADLLPDGILKSCVAIDPAASAHGQLKLDASGQVKGGKKDSNFTGIVVCAAGDPPGTPTHDIGATESHSRVRAALLRLQRMHGYVLADASMQGTPDQWARAAVRLYHEFECNYIVAEANQGGDMVKSVIRTIDSAVDVRLVHATKNKQTRAEPIVALYEQGRIHHIGKFPDLENQMLTWDPNLERYSPDRIDALVWGMHSLLVRKRPTHGGHPQELGVRPNPWAIFN